MKNLVNSEDFSFDMMKKALGDYSNLKLDILNEPSKEKAIGTKKSIVESKVEKIARAFERSLKDLSEEFISALSDSASDPLIGYHVEGYNHLAGLLHSSNLQKPTYRNLLTELHSQQIVFAFHGMLCCAVCVDNRITLTTRSEISPHHLEMTCPRCGHPMVASIFYGLDQTVKDCILSKNGLLGLSIGWLLRRNQLEYEIEAYNGHAHDFVVTSPSGKFLIECKMHRNDNLNERNVRMWLDQDLKQLGDHLAESNNRAVSNAVLVYNFAIAPYLAMANEMINQKYPRIVVTDYNGIYGIIEKLKPK